VAAQLARSSRPAESERTAILGATATKLIPRLAAVTITDEGARQVLLRRGFALE
jgi:hypothetical protein